MGLPHYKDPLYGRLWHAINASDEGEPPTRPRPDNVPLLSSRANQADMDHHNFLYWMREIKEPPGYCRKQWEHAYICQALFQSGKLKPGMRGLGFGVGKEPLIALFARYGVEVVATDAAITPEIQGWVDSDQHIREVGDLNDRGIVSDDEFKRLVRYREVDMNNIPADLQGFDFTWSANSLDHLGSIPQGLQFITESIRRLKPGGIAVHTSEFNASSNDKTVDSGGVVFFRARDIQEYVSRTSRLARIEPLALEAPTGPVDILVDHPPYHNEPHLTLRNLGYDVTSFGIIAHRL